MKNYLKNRKYINSIAIGCLLSVTAHAAITLVSDDFSTSSIGTTLTFGEAQAPGLTTSAWNATSGTNWTIGSGSLTNAGGGTNAQSHGALAILINLSSITDASLSQLNLSFNYQGGAAGDDVYVHLWGINYTGTDPAGTATMVNNNATTGNMWATAGTTHAGIELYNLGKLNGAFTGSSIGLAADAATVLTNVGTTLQTYNNTFDLSANTTSPTSVAGYEYLVVAITRNHATSLSIDNFLLTAAVPEPSSMALLALGLTSLMMMRRRKA